MSDCASSDYEVSNDAKTASKVLKGLLACTDIENDTSFKWFKENMKLGQADVAAVSTFGKNGSKFQMVVFASTWCDDSQNLLPVFYRLVEKSGYPDSSITLIGVDRPKTTLYNLHNAFHITDIPTFIVMKDGKEIGRVVKYGKYGQIDKELGEIVSVIQ
jgi:thiol-disulfide isomerase/thioredoxin